ncbi:MULTISPECIES: hypothetical protein [unclassified Nocardiopsis]|uniref:hypothetical protein n=1 Tax=unclassified Nocardiopsis TaxID=2649073 RepID=UPI001F5BBD37|nr:hypothetical protein [Nocardiopsis sp. TSRI0078]
MERSLGHVGEETQQGVPEGTGPGARRRGERVLGPVVDFGAVQDPGDEQSGGDGGRVDRALVDDRAVEVVRSARALLAVAGEQGARYAGASAPEP